MPPTDDSLARLLKRAAAAPARECPAPLSPALEAAVLRAWRTARAESAARPSGLLGFLALDGLLAPALGGAAALVAAVLVWTTSLPGERAAATSADGLTAEIEELVSEPAALLAYENS